LLLIFLGTASISSCPLLLLNLIGRLLRARRGGAAYGTTGGEGRCLEGDSEAISRVHHFQSFPSDFSSYSTRMMLKLVPCVSCFDLSPSALLVLVDFFLTPCRFEGT
jgi:hypothetical protein